MASHISVLPKAKNFQVNSLAVNVTNAHTHTHNTQIVCPDGQSQEGKLFTYLQPIPDASHTRDRKVAPDSACLSGTRKGVMKMIADKVCGTMAPKKHIFCLYGYEGSGKSAIAQELCEKAPRLLASFFFSRNAGDRSQIGRLPNTLSSQLAYAIPETVQSILAAVEGNPYLASPQSNLALGARLQALVYEPFEKFVERRSPIQKWRSEPYLIVIDGLDECADKDGVQEFLECTLKFFEKKPFVPLCVFVTSRVDHQGHLKSDRVYVEDLADHSSEEDIEALMRAKFDPYAERDPAVQAYLRQHGSWPNPSDARKLVEHSGGSFLFASELFQLILNGSGSEDQELTPITRLALILERKSGLDILYSKTLARAEHLPHRHEVISSLAFIRDSLPVPVIADLLGLQPNAIKNILVELQTIIRLPGTDDCPVTFHHPSLRDFLTTESRAGGFYAPPTFHLYLSLRCFIIILRHRRHPGQPSLAAAYSKRYEDIHWREAEYAFQEQTARSRIFKLCSKARRCQPSPEAHALYLDKIGVALLAMINHREVTFRIDWVASLHRETLEFRTSPDAAWALTLDNLGIALCRLFEDTGNTLAVEEAISRFRKTRSLRPSPHPHLPVSLNNLGNALYAQFQQSGCINQILEAIEVHREALRLRLSPDLNRSFSLENLGNALLARYEHHRAISDVADVADVEEAIGMHREALSLQDRASILSNLGDALRSRGEHFGRISDHDEAIYMHQRAHLVFEGCLSITRCWILMNTGISFYSRSRISGSVKDLMQAISFLTESLNLISSQHIYRPKALRYLIVSLQSLSKRDNSIDSLDEKIKHSTGELDRALHDWPQARRRVFTQAQTSAQDECRCNGSFETNPKN